MTEDGGHRGGQRIATADGAMLADPASLGNVAGIETLDDALAQSLFDPGFWAARGELSDVTRGRGSAWFISRAPHEWALRHYRRGGLIARLVADRYVWAGEERVRAFVEWRLLAALRRLELPVPQPVAARYRRHGLLYRCDLITLRISGAEPLSVRLAMAAVPAASWHELGKTVARLHAAGVDHADLNAHNLLLDEAGAVSVIDFDRGKIRAVGSRSATGLRCEAGSQGARGSAQAPAPASATAPAPDAGMRSASALQPAAWMARNIARLRRSLDKIAAELPVDRYGARQWRWLLDGYESALRL